jgi:hypothetical protein
MDETMTAIRRAIIDEDLAKWHYPPPRRNRPLAVATAKKGPISEIELATDFSA